MNRSLIQYHELLWRDFARRHKLQLTRNENGFYLHPITRESYAAWIERSSVEHSDGPKAYHNAALCLASTTAYELLLSIDKELAIKVAKAIQSMRIGYGEADS
jgi:hypothetical protein